MTTESTPPRRRRAWLWVLAVPPALLAALVGIGLATGLFRPERPAGPESAPPPPDPRLVYAGPYRNVHPSAGYAGDATCAGCHPEQYDSFRRHPMGRSLAPAGAEAAAAPHYGPESRNPFDALGRRFRVERRGGQVWHTQSALADGEVLYELRQPVHWAVGSGTRGFSYLREEGGFVYQSPVSWYAQKGIWDLSPSFGAANVTGRPVLPGCLQCHADRARPVRGEGLRFEPGVFDGLAIGCERCHGPGRAHAERWLSGAAWEPGETDLTVVSPAKLPRALRDAVCEQCHLQGEQRVLRRGRGWFDYRPGLPLEAFVAVFVKAGGGRADARAVNHVEQMRASACYQKSAGKARELGCSSCHDPHSKPEPGERLAFFRARCLTCHAEGDCGGPPAQRRAKADSCADCHMPREAVTNVAHTSLTDHSVPRRPGAAPGRAPAARWTRVPLVNFHADRLGRDDPEVTRDLGVALARVQGKARTAEEADLLGAEALSRLDAAVRRAPDDAAAWLARGEVLARGGRYGEVVPSLERVLELWPRDLAALDLLGRVERSRGRRDQAAGYLRRAVEAAPHRADYRHELVSLLVEEERWDEARPHAREWVKLDPGSAAARQAWMMCLAKVGDKDGARRQMKLLRKMHPPQLPQLERWFARNVGR